MLEKSAHKKKRGFFRLIFWKIQLKQDARAACWGILRANPCFPRFARNPHARQAKHQIDQNPAAINMQKTGLCQMVLMTSKTSLQKWSGVFLFPSVSPVFFQIGTVTYQHRLRFRWRGFMYEFLPLIRKARTRCDLCRALHDFANQRWMSRNVRRKRRWE